MTSQRSRLGTGTAALVHGEQLAPCQTPAHARASLVEGYFGYRSWDRALPFWAQRFRKCVLRLVLVDWIARWPRVGRKKEETSPRPRRTQSDPSFDPVKLTAVGIYSSVRERYLGDGPFRGQASQAMGEDSRRNAGRQEGNKE